MSEVPEDRLQAQMDFEEDMRENPSFYNSYLNNHHEDYPESPHWDYIIDKWVAYDHGVTMFFNTDTFHESSRSRPWQEPN